MAKKPRARRSKGNQDQKQHREETTRDNQIINDGSQAIREADGANGVNGAYDFSFGKDGHSQATTQTGNANMSYIDSVGLTESSRQSFNAGTGGHAKGTDGHMNTKNKAQEIDLKKDHYHTGLIDAADEGRPLSQVDYDPLIILDDDGQEAGVEINNSYFGVQGELLMYNPYAGLTPSNKVPLKNAYEKAKDLRTPKPGSHTTNKMFIKYMKGKRNEDRYHQQRTRKVRSEANREKLIRKSKMDEVAEAINESESQLYRLATVVSNKKFSVKNSREEAAKMFYIPSNITARAISLLFIAHIAMLRGPNDKPRFNLPPADTAEHLAFNLGFNDIIEMEYQIKHGSMMRAMKAYKQLALTDVDDNRISHELDDYLATIDTPKAQARSKLLDQELAELVEFDEVSENSADESEEVMQQADFDELRKVLNATQHKTKLMPFVFGKVYTYKILYFFYLTEYKFIMPFGKTIPDATWLLIVSYILDPNNILGLRLEMNSYILKVGGLPLLEKSKFFDETTDRIIRSLFRPTLTQGANDGTLKRVTTAVLTNFIKLKEEHRKLSELKDEQDYTKGQIDKMMRELRGSIEDHELQDSVSFSHRLSKLQSLVNAALSSKKSAGGDLYKGLMAQLGVDADFERQTIEDFEELLSSNSFQMANLMLNYSNQMKKGDFDSKAWFVFVVLKHHDGSADHFSIIYDMLMSGDFNGVLALLFRSKEAAEQVKNHIMVAEEIIMRADSAEYIDMLSSEVFKTGDFRVKWVEQTADSIIEENPTLARLVQESLVQSSDAQQRNYYEDDEYAGDNQDEDGQYEEEVFIDDQETEKYWYDQDETADTYSTSFLDQNQMLVASLGEFNPQQLAIVRKTEKRKHMLQRSISDKFDNEDVQSQTSQSFKKRKPTSDEERYYSNQQLVLYTPSDVVVDQSEVSVIAPTTWHQRIKKYGVAALKVVYKAFLVHLTFAERLIYLMQMYELASQFIALPGVFEESRTIAKKAVSVKSIKKSKQSAVFLKSAASKLLRLTNLDSSPMARTAKKLLLIIIDNLNF